MGSNESARDIATTAALLSGQLDGLMSAWERSISETTPEPGRTGAINISELERELSSLDAATAAARTAAEAHSKQADAWDAKARVATHDGRKDLADVAIQRANEHREAGRELRIEAGEMDKVGQELRSTVDLVRREQTGQESTRPAI
jgi:hypothetical protein